ncbi:MAG: type IX secretion system outer membrane channel protein PorV [Cyclobacteriaceae bacterium]|nr:type IX secretion system outer membrane channel protein PorV [Cyclobacteriaceae bacterium HetDA_MAG_MS6]
MRGKVYGGLLTVILLSPVVLSAQNTNAQNISAQEGGNPITVAVPFLSFAPDSRGSAMGDAGVATSPDAYSVHWNNAKLAFIDNDLGFSFSYSPWLGNIVDDMSLNYLTFYKRIDRLQSIGATLRYFDLGEIQLTDDQGGFLELENPREAAFDATYSRKLSERMSIGVTGRFIWSNLSGNITGATGVNAGTSVAVDVGFYYTQPIIFSGRNSEISFGAHISNLGQKITYSDESNEDFIPANLRLGMAFKTNLDAYNTLTFAFDVNKLMVPSPPVYLQTADGLSDSTDLNNNKIIASGKSPDRALLSGTFGSFGDAPDGFGEELKELMFSVGAEYWYRDVFALRGGYFHEHAEKGDRQYFTAGLGFRYQVFGVDFSYLIPTDQGHPLGDTLRLSLIFSLDKEESGQGVNTL